MQKRTIPGLPARLIDPRPVIGVGIVVCLVVFIVAMMTPGQEMWVHVSLWGLVIGLGIYLVFAWQRAAVRRGSRTAQSSLPDVEQKGDQAYEILSQDESITSSTP